MLAFGNVARSGSSAQHVPPILCCALCWNIEVPTFSHVRRHIRNTGSSRGYENTHLSVCCVAPCRARQNVLTMFGCPCKECSVPIVSPNNTQSRVAKCLVAHQCYHCGFDTRQKAENILWSDMTVGSLHGLSTLQFPSPPTSGMPEPADAAKCCVRNSIETGMPELVSAGTSKADPTKDRHTVLPNKKILHPAMHGITFVA